MIKRISLLLLLLVSGQSFAQGDPHFSMWQGSLSFLNPAATAAMKEDFSFFSNYRGQWMNTSPLPVRTNAFCAEAKAFKEKLGNGWLGLGLHFYNDELGVTKMSTNAAYVPINYILETGDNSTFSLAVRPGFINRELVGSFQTWDHQWNGITFDQTTLDLEGSARKFTVFDMSAGTFFQTEFYNGSRWNIGFVVDHVTMPDVSFRYITDQLNRRYILHTGAQLKVRNARFRLSPQVTSVYQGPLSFHQFGSSIDLTLKEGSQRTTFVQDRTLGFGLYYRTQDAIIASMILQLEGFTVGLSFDATISKANLANKYNGAMEVFLKYAFVKEKRKRFIR